MLVFENGLYSPFLKILSISYVHIIARKQSGRYAVSATISIIIELWKQHHELWSVETPGVIDNSHPPSTARLCPLTYFASSLAKYSPAMAISSTLRVGPCKLPIRLLWPSMAAFSFSETGEEESAPPLNIFAVRGVATAEGETALTLIPYLPSSAAPFLVSPMTACLEAVYEYGAKSS
jgi:hypothetical protein